MQQKTEDEHYKRDINNTKRNVSDINRVDGHSSFDCSLSINCTSNDVSLLSHWKFKCSISHHQSSNTVDITPTLLSLSLNSHCIPTRSDGKHIHATDSYCSRIIQPHADGSHNRHRRPRRHPPRPRTRRLHGPTSPPVRTLKKGRG